MVFIRVKNAFIEGKDARRRTSRPGWNLDAAGARRGGAAMAVVAAASVEAT
jgi:hypothetical protein